MYSSDHIRMAALGNKLFTIGSASDKELPRLIALDARTGDIIWQYGDANVSVLTVSANQLFIGELGGGRVTALNPDTGAIEWSTNGRIGNVTNVLVRENILYVDTVGGGYFLFDADTGNILQTIPYTVGEAPNPDIPIWSDHNMNLQFVGNMGFFQYPTDFPMYKGEITATDEISGNQIWTSGSFYAATRLAASPLGIFVLDSDGKLLSFGLTDGEMNQVIQFEPAPTLRNEDGDTYGYYVAVDSDNQLLFLYLGDSAQLFAFHIQ
jgi:outer membrane protein assembly factor BamB